MQSWYVFLHTTWFLGSCKSSNSSARTSCWHFISRSEHSKLSLMRRMNGWRTTWKCYNKPLSVKILLDPVNLTSVTGLQPNIGGFWKPYDCIWFAGRIDWYRFGPDNKKAISAYVGTRTVTQIRTHMQKYKLRMVGSSISRSHSMINWMTSIQITHRLRNQLTPQVLMMINLIMQIPHLYREMSKIPQPGQLKSEEIILRFRTPFNLPNCPHCKLNHPILWRGKR